MATIQISPYRVLDLAAAAQKVLQDKLAGIKSTNFGIPLDLIYSEREKSLVDSLIAGAHLAIENGSVLGSLMQIDTQEIDVLTKYGK